MVHSSTSADEQKAGDWSEMESDGTSSTNVEWETRKKNDVCSNPPEDVPEHSRKLAGIQLSPTYRFSRGRQWVRRPTALGTNKSGRSPRTTKLTRPLCSTETPATASDGELLLPSLLLFNPQYCKLDGQKLAHSWWRKRAPTRSRRPLPRVICS